MKRVPVHPLGQHERGVLKANEVGEVPIPNRASALERALVGSGHEVFGEQGAGQFWEALGVAMLSTCPAGTKQPQLGIGRPLIELCELTTQVSGHLVELAP